eukprot:TRINITY_DN667_c3_g1_i1.p1 TRINITY_DN667_c3_g1~~TRINITY_DN667_c3_g1_i1.p1  ORF type:complete len:2404 (+),score=646.70 TRINITY_DN667_c3_g1_i1:103-7314(+)
MRAALALGLVALSRAVVITPPAGDRDNILKEINTLRAQYGAKELTWDAQLAVQSGTGGVLDRCDIAKETVDTKFAKGQISIGHPYITDNAAAFDPPRTEPTFSIAFAIDVSSRVALKQYDDTPPDTHAHETEAVKHLVQVLWKGISKVGCSACTRESASTTGLIYAGWKCTFDIEGRQDGEYAANLGKKGDPVDRCFGTTCPSKACNHKAVCDSNTGLCQYSAEADGTACTLNAKAGECNTGVCQVPDLCWGVVCLPKSVCHLKGTCEPSTGNCSNPVKTNDQFGTSLECDDGNSQTTDDMCNNGVCLGTNRCENVVCPSTQCKMSTCIAATGMCEETNVPNGQSCNDGNSSTNSDTCDGQGVCIGTAVCSEADKKACVNKARASSCRDASLCDSCILANLADGTPCDDLLFHTFGDRCIDGECRHTHDICTNVTCVPSNECRGAHCNIVTGECDEFDIDAGNDNKKCTSCQGVTCDPPTACQVTGVCINSTGNCEYLHAPDNTPCNDNNDATVDDVCKSGVCAGVDNCANVVCAAPATACLGEGTCDKNTGACEYLPLPDTLNGNPRPCDDGQSATDQDKCVNGKCTGTPTCRTMGSNITCATDDPCKIPTCVNGECRLTHVPDKTPCDDEKPNTTHDQCTAGECVGTDKCANKKCPAESLCYKEGTCNPDTGKCIPRFNDGVTCDDEQDLTVNDVCELGKCMGQNLCNGKECRAEGPCFLDGTCDPQTGLCSRHIKPAGGPCNDGNNQTKFDTCDMYGKCEGVELCEGVVCLAMSSCHGIGVCNPNTGMCSNPKLAAQTPCDDGLNITVGDVCDGDGHCAGINLCKDVSCLGAATFCMESECNPDTGRCDTMPVADGKKCSPDGSMCQGGECINKCANKTCPMLQCFSSNVCDPASGECVAEAANTTVACDDGDLSTAPDMCDGMGNCTGPNVCDGVTCVAKGGCYVAGECNVTKASMSPNDPDVCTHPMKKDGTVCDDEDDTTFDDVCRLGECVGNTCEITLKNTYGVVVCKAGAASQTGIGGYGFTPDGNLYTDGGCSGKFEIRGTGESIECTSTGGYTDCALRLSVAKRCLPTVPVCKTCVALNECHEAGVCDAQTGNCTNPPKPDGSKCDDKDAATLNDKCVQGECTGTEVPGCYVPSTYSPSRECDHDPDACSWASGVWDTVEECCRPGNGHAKGCAPEPQPPTECWRPGKWWPMRECVQDDAACDWTLGTDVWGTKEECCKAGNGFDCGCVTPPPPTEKTCFVKAIGSPIRSCITRNFTGVQSCEGVTGTLKAYRTEEECCKEEHDGGCAMACKSLDVVLVIDGSGSMRKSFTGHPHGFYALVSMLDDWVRDLPLTGTKAGEAAEAGVRVGVVQFSSKYGRGPYPHYYGSTPHVSAAKVTSRRLTKTTGGRLSGDVGQLTTDIAWHRQQFMNAGTMIRVGLEMAAAMFEDNDRPRALVLITDGEVHDVPNTKEVRKELDRKDVVVFGVVLRRYYSHSQVDVKAEETLRPLLSQPIEDHFFNLEIDDVPEKVLHGCCDPNSRWGKYIKTYSKGATITRPPVDPTKFVSVPGSATGASNIFLLNKPVKPFSDLDCDVLHSTSPCGTKANTCDEDLDSVSVNIDSGFMKGVDTLTCSACKSKGIRVEYQRSVGVLYLKGSRTTVRDMTKALASVVFVTKATQCSDRTFTFAYGQGFCDPNSGTNHKYRYYSSRKIDWNEAREACEGKVVLGQKGYLITITSAEEQKVAQTKLGGTGWMGGSDLNNEGEFKWVTGPEACPGQQSCSGEFDLGQWTRRGVGSYKGIQGTPLTYTNWKSYEPNDYRKSCPGACKRAGEDFMNFVWPTGKWNDYPMDAGQIRGYVCEWGGQSCLVNDVGTRTLQCKSDNTIPTNPCMPRPTKPLAKSGCASGWVALEDTITRDWCNNNCVERNGKLSESCKPGKKEVCACLPERVQQCRCEDPSMMMSDNYCANLQPEASGLHKCFAATEEMDGAWDEVVTDAKGMPPSIGGDEDESFKCHIYDRAAKTWGTVTEGQCRDKDWVYYTRYIYTESSAEKCKKTCEEKAGCHSVSFENNNIDPSRCHLNSIPIGSCQAGQARCKAPSTKPPGVASCGCKKFIKGAKPSDGQVCVQEINGETVCAMPGFYGQCPQNTKPCTRRPTTATLVKKGTDLKIVIQIIATAGGLSRHQIKITHACTNCKLVNKYGRKVYSCGKDRDSKCTGSVSYKKTSGSTPGRDAQVLEVEGESVLKQDTVLHIDYVGVDDVQREAAVNRIHELTDKAASLSPELMTEEERNAISDLDRIGATGTMALVEPVYDEPESRPESPKEEEEDESKSWIAILIGCIVGIFLVGMVGYAFAHRKRSTSFTWTDVGEAQIVEPTADEAAGKSYQQMTEVEPEPTPSASASSLEGAPKDPATLLV